MPEDLTIARNHLTQAAMSGLRFANRFSLEINKEVDLALTQFGIRVAEARLWLDQAEMSYSMMKGEQKSE